MPIYRYQCRKCEEIGEYLVSGILGRPDTCRKCGYTDFDRVFDGQTFCPVVGSSKKEKDPIIEPGIYVAGGITRDGKDFVDIFRVQAGGEIDALVRAVSKRSRFFSDN
jgi:putative FmdB family regulatory protein